MQPEPRLVKTRWGFYTYEPKPSADELQAYYRDKYYQEGHGSYEVTYTEEEKTWLRLRDLVSGKMRSLLGGRCRRMLDIGCGEGWLMDAFHRAGCEVRGLDYSSAGIAKLHPHLLPRLTQGDLYENMETLIRGGQRYDAVSCCNVMEHVLDPSGLLGKLRQVLAPTGYLVVIVPNDFSALHEHLLAGGFIKKPWWLRYPDHISYFNKASMECFLADHGFAVDAVIADHPVDLNLLNDNSNYIEEPSKGKAVHRFRIRTDNFLASISRDKLLQLYELLGSMGVGRNLIYCARPVERGQAVG